MSSVTVHEIYVRRGGDEGTRLKVLTEAPQDRWYVYVFMISSESYDIVPLTRKRVKPRRGMLRVVTSQPLRRKKDLDRIPSAVKIAVQRYQGRPYELRAYHARQ